MPHCHSGKHCWILFRRSQRATGKIRSGRSTPKQYSGMPGALEKIMLALGRLCGSKLWPWCSATGNGRSAHRAAWPGPGFNLSVGIGLTEIRCATFAPHVRAMRPVCAKGRTALWDIDGAWRALACHDSATHRPEVKYGVGFEADPDHAVTSVESPGVTGLINAGC